MPRNKQKNLARAVAHRAERMKDIRLQKNVSISLMGVSERVHKALTMIDYKASPRPAREAFEGGSTCLPEVAMFAAGHRKSNNITAR
ncbi:Uncharacterised protein [Serratia entomophila]|uniref:transcriptional antitermination N peptide n=1 Tax=Serratia entomophila TaxID=42906 RepID=UPI00217BA8EF|nr:hypothetical protein [Serratia entomophila]CAI1926554.1 Uncharacterised protein [Serratia entomophila]